MILIVLISILATVIPTIAYILFLRWLDRYERKPWGIIGLACILGAFASLLFSFVGNMLIWLASLLTLSKGGSLYVLAGLFAPFFEEIAKALIIILLAWASSAFDKVTSGLIFGAIIGLGFAMTENFIYFIRIYREAGQFAWIENMYLRGFFTAGVHACGAAVFGAAIGYTRSSRWSEKVMVGLMGLGVAIIVHSFWNSILVIAEITHDPVLGKLPYFSLPLLFALLFVFFLFCLYREAHLIEVELGQEVESGLIPAPHLAHLKSYFSRREEGWLEKEIPRDEYVALAVNLAFLKNRYWRASNEKKAAFEKEIIQTRQKIKQLFEKTAALQT